MKMKTRSFFNRLLGAFLALAIPNIVAAVKMLAYADGPALTSAKPEVGMENFQRFRELLAREDWQAATNVLAMAKRLQHQPNVAEGRLTVDTPILIDWYLCVRKGNDQAEALKPAVYQYPWLEFARAHTGWVAAVHLRHLSWPHCAWKLKLRVLDRSATSGSVLTQAEAVLENSGNIERYAEIQDTVVRLNLPFPAAIAESQPVFQLALETLWIEQGNPVRWEKPLPLSLDLSTTNTSGILRCKSLELVKAADAVRAVMQARVVSSPKCHWRVGLTLYNAREQVIGTGHLEIENSGIIRRAPMVTLETFKIPISGEPQALQSAHRWNLRIDPISP